MNCSPEGCEDIQISPDGQYAVWAGAHELWIASVSGKEAVRKLAYTRGKSSQPQWSPDSKKVVFVSHLAKDLLMWHEQTPYRNLWVFATDSRRAGAKRGKPALRLSTVMRYHIQPKARNLGIAK